MNSPCLNKNQRTEMEYLVLVISVIAINGAISSTTPLLGYPLTKEDFDYGRNIDLSAQISEGTNAAESDPHEHGIGNYEGDMILTPQQLLWIQGQSRALHSQVNYWPRNGTYVNIPYKISSIFTD